MQNFNPSQLKAIQHQGSHLLIVAGPGTGKTHTLTHRIAQIVPQLSGSQKILAITFTNKAAQEMRDRLSTLTSNHQDLIMVGTFHQFCLQILRQYIEKTELPNNFRVAQEKEIQQSIKNIWPNVKLREQKAIQNKMSLWKSTQFDLPILDEVLAYNAMLRKEGLLDFDDLLLETLYLLRKNEDVLTQARETFRFIFVDEYQDINRVQYELLKCLIGPTNELTAIGDPHQAIYGFRGADAEYFERFTNDFPNTVVLSLEDNYRSAQNILSASQQVIAKLKSKEIPDLVAKIYSQGRLVIYASHTDRAEAEYVVHNIEKMVGGTSMFSQDSGRVDRATEGDVGFGDIAVLYRLHSQRHALQEAFDRSGIPYHVSGAKASLEFEDDICPPREEEVTLDVEKVSLMTIHAAKGLEFSVVFIVGCEENILPLNLEGLVSSEDEERRLFYVGMTRARERLFLTYSQERLIYGKKVFHEPSRFLTDIEEQLKEYELSQAIRPPKKEDPQITFF